ncbi:MAG: orotidine-5'-phosphate decarboxylase [Candidatus Dasytiphilus stammeri]
MFIDSPLIVALDYSSRNGVMALVDNIDPALCRLKVGKELFTLLGPKIVRELQQRGFEVFLDLKFHDIPHTVAHAVTIAAELGVWMVNVHASGGAKMMSAANEALLPFKNEAPLLMAVTMLTSLNAQDLPGIGLNSSISEHTQLLARLTYECGLDGIICSASDASQVKKLTEKSLIIVTPGIRPDLSDPTDHDPDRIMTPYQAIGAGVDYLVIGRPITHSINPAKTLTAVYSSLIKLKYPQN